MLHTQISAASIDYAEEYTPRDLLALPPRLDNAQVTALDRFARSPLPPSEACSLATFGKCMAMLGATLPRSVTDETTGQIRFEAYHKKLGHLPREAIGLLVGRALDRCKWFPTIAECLELVSDWEADARRARGMAQNRAARERQERLDEARKALKWGRLEQHSIDALPDRWKNILECESLLRRHEDGSFTARAPLFAPVGSL